jgi:hypothetical protein
MSTQSPITTEPTACNTNWITKAACKLQAIVEPLCEKRSNFVLNAFEQNAVMLDLRSTNNISGFTEQANYTSEQWRNLIAVEKLCYSEAVEKILAPRLTLWNKLGLSAWKVFSIGTTCSCCWGLRFIVVSVVAFSIGFLTRSYL